MLLDSLFGTERGLRASSELRGEINELITQLEAGSPTSAPNEVQSSGSTVAGRQPRLRLKTLEHISRGMFVSAVVN